jgi:putative protease
VKRGDGVSFDCGRAVDDGQGGRVCMTSYKRGNSVELSFGHGAIDFEQIQPGMRVWKNDDPELNTRLRKSFTSADPQRRTAVDLAIRAAVDQPLQVEVTTETGLHFSFAGSQLCAEARKHPLTEATLREQFGRLGGTPFVLRELSSTIAGQPMLPFSVLGEMRHDGPAGGSVHSSCRGDQ